MRPRFGPRCGHGLVLRAAPILRRLPLAVSSAVESEKLLKLLRLIEGGDLVEVVHAC